MTIATQPGFIEKRPIVFGEVLFDTFPDGSAVLGGAPFNVAWHLQGFGAKPLFISRIGDDEQGIKVQQAMYDWGMDTSGVQLDKNYPTGIVKIELEQGQPSFNIVPNQAYDYIDPSLALQSVQKTSSPTLIYHGTLIERSSISSTALTRLRELGYPSFVDINLREPWWDEKKIKAALGAATWLKINEDEIKIVMAMVNIKNDDPTQAAQQLRKHFNLELVIVTLGEEGAFVVADNEIIKGAPVKVDNLVDTVGAGDAFSAVMLLGRLNEWELNQTLLRSLEFASLVCGNRGATIKDHDVYKKCLEKWITS